jgi:uncharacterized membrane protein
MDTIIKPGRWFFAIGIMALGVLSIVMQDFIVGRPPAWPGGLAVNPLLAYVTGTIFIIASLAIILKKKSVLAALVVAVLIFLLSILRHLPHFAKDWGNGLKSFALFGGALIAACAFFEKDKNSRLEFLSNTKRRTIIILFGTISLSAFLIASGILHFQFAGFVNDFIPAYIPFHPFWTYFCAIALFAGGTGILIKPIRKLAAVLCGVMIFLWFLLLHIPRAVNAPHEKAEWMGVFESLTFAGFFFLLAYLFSKKDTAADV